MGNVAQQPTAAAGPDRSGGPATAPAGVARWFGGISARTGLQGNLVLCFMVLMTAAVGASCWLFARETNAVLDRMAGAHAVELSRALAMASETPLERRDAAELERIGADLMKHKGMSAVAFFDAQGQLLSVSSQDPDVDARAAETFANPKYDGRLMELQHGWLPSIGRYSHVTTPVLRYHGGSGSGRPTAGAGPPTVSPRSNNRLVGYITVWISQGENDSRVRNVQLTVVLIGAVSALVSLPVMYWLVHRVFLPIRQLVAATDRIAAGDLDAQVAIHRPDVIGTLARSFNEMVRRVRQQQDDLADANAKLADANASLETTNGQLAEANRQLADANSDLEAKVRQRTAELEATAGKLASTNARIRREIAEKEDFLRAVSHDLNAPLRNISGMAAMLLMKYRDTLEEDVVHRLERIQKNVQVETDLIAELLELSRIKTRRQRMEPVDIGEVVRELGEVLAQDLETRQIRLVIDTPLPTLTCERARVRQVFQNLIDNAIKYMGDGSPPDGAGPGAAPVREIHVGSAPAGPDGVEFYVRDTGIGIEADELDKVFCVFRRGKHQAVQGVAGKGVGLASVKSIVETYNGTIRVESRVGRGSTFRFTLDPQSPPAGTSRAA